MGVVIAASIATAAVAAEPPPADPPIVVLPPVEVIAPTPLIGSGVERDTVPAETHVLDSNALKRDGTPDLLRALDKQVGGVSLDSASGNPFQPTLFYHGFAASPLQGTPQGLAVYVNGMRFNQPFGDTVNWDLLPSLAIDRLNIEGSNPVFGLNALGGSVNVQLKNGFTWQGTEATLSGGSFGQRQADFEYGRNDHGLSTYFAGTVLHQDGWREFQSSDLQTAFADIGWRSPRGELHLGIIGTHSLLNGPGTAPVQLLAIDGAAQFTAPNSIENHYAALNLRASVELGESASLQALAYYQYFLQNVVNGNAPNDTPCNDGSGLLCSNSGVSTTLGGTPIADFLNGGPYGELDQQTTSTHAYGAAVQFTNTANLFGRRNHLVGGVTFDGAQTEFDATSFIGGLAPDSRFFYGPAVVIDEPGTNSPVSVGIANATWGLYLSDAFNLAERLTLTISGRLNAAFIDLDDHNGGDLGGSHSYVHLNPAAGLAWQATPWLTVYGGYAVANRAPTPAELSCASPANSCSLANFFVGDPDLRQVVAQTFEAGLRGNVKLGGKAQLRYDLALFHSDLDDDIAFVNSVTQGRAYFANIGRTQRQGLDANLQFENGPWSAYAAYTFIDATYQSGFVEASGNNPAADSSGSITIQPGSHLPGIPQHQLKLGAYYKVTDNWTLGATAVAASSAFLFGDEANLTPPLPSYVTLGVSTTYQAGRNVQLFARAENITNTTYYTYGTFSPTAAVPIAPGASNPRSLSPAAPFGVFGGVRISF